MRAGFVGFGLLLALAQPALTQPALAEPAHSDLLGAPNDAKFGPAPASFPAGAQVAVLSGNPFEAGTYVLRLKMPAGYTIPAHHHATVENVTIISGQFHAGMGDKIDRAHGLTFSPGGFAALPANMNHFAWTTAPTVIQVHGMGPFEISYVNPADNPAKK